MPLISTGRTAFALLLATGLLSFPAVAQSGESDPRIDPTGRDLAVFPPDPVFTYVHYKLVIDIPDMSKPQFAATAIATIRPISMPQTMIKLRAGRGLTITGATIDGRSCTYTHTEETLEVVFPGPLGVGQTGNLEITYTANRPGGGGAGLTWSRDFSQTPEEDFMFHSQGQPESNHLWFPCHDFPNVRLTSEIEVTIPKGYDALSNGRLVSMARHTDGTGRTTFHWLQDVPHSFYLMSLIVGKFDIVNVGGPKSARPGLWMPVYGPLGSGDHIRESFGNTAEMVALYEKLFDEPYPYAKYAQSIARDFSAGAMENTSATTFAPFAATARGEMLDGIIAHELVHQWFGDMVGYRSWEHLWLGEGWATYGEALWAEHQGGSRAYHRAILSNLRRERGSGRNYAPASGGMATNRYSDPSQRFMSTDNVYSKGGVVLHMLRKRLGDDTFWKGVALYLDRYRNKLAETNDFRRCLEEASGQSLERFFDQWVIRPGNPTIEVDYTWNAEAKTLTIAIEQSQRIDANNPAYAITIPVDIQTKENGEWRSIYINMDTRRAEQTIKLDEKPAAIEVDSEMTLLMRTRIRQPLAAVLHQVEHGRTYYARACAIDALREFDDPQAIAMLERVGRDALADGDEYLTALARETLEALIMPIAGK